MVEGSALSLLEIGLKRPKTSLGQADYGALRAASEMTTILWTGPRQDRGLLRHMGRHLAFQLCIQFGGRLP